jgi:hypothetical protein
MAEESLRTKKVTLFKHDDVLPNLIIAVAYFSIPLQLLASLWQYPRLAAMPYKILVLLVLFALFIFLCGTGHLLRCLEKAAGLLLLHQQPHGVHFAHHSALPVPLIPNLFGIIDQNRDSIKQNEEIAESKANLLFMAFCAMRFAIRSLLLRLRRNS